MVSWPSAERLRGDTRRADDLWRQRNTCSASCEIVDKKKIGEIIYSCQAEKLSLADIKATVEACLGDKAFAFAGNENPNTPFLRYNPQLGDVQGARDRLDHVRQEHARDHEAQR